jgi:hypothetical protein
VLDKSFRFENTCRESLDRLYTTLDLGVFTDNVLLHRSACYGAPVFTIS